MLLGLPQRPALRASFSLGLADVTAKRKLKPVRASVVHAIDAAEFDAQRSNICNKLATFDAFLVSIDQWRSWQPAL